MLYYLYPIYYLSPNGDEGGGSDEGEGGEYDSDAPSSDEAADAPLSEDEIAAATAVEAEPDSLAKIIEKAEKVSFDYHQKLLSDLVSTNLDISHSEKEVYNFVDKQLPGKEVINNDVINYGFNVEETIGKIDGVNESKTIDIPGGNITVKNIENPLLPTSVRTNVQNTFTLNVDVVDDSVETGLVDVSFIPVQSIKVSSVDNTLVPVGYTTPIATKLIPGSLVEKPRGPGEVDDPKQIPIGIYVIKPKPNTDFTIEPTVETTPDFPVKYYYKSDVDGTRTYVVIVYYSPSSEVSTGVVDEYVNISYSTTPINITKQFNKIKSLLIHNNVNEPPPLITATFKFKSEQDFLKFKALIQEHVYDGEKVFDGMQKKEEKNSWYPHKERPSKYIYV